MIPLYVISPNSPFLFMTYASSQHPKENKNEVELGTNFTVRGSATNTELRIDYPFPMKTQRTRRKDKKWLGR